MKKLIFPIVLVSFLAVCCSKKSNSNTDSNSQLPLSVTNIITQAQIDSLKSWGMPVNTGNTPPDITGDYLSSPDKLFWSNVPNESPMGTVFGQVRYHFYEQQGNNVKISYNLIKSLVGSRIDTMMGQGAFISGSGNLFTLFAKAITTTAGIEVTGLFVISGEINSSGVKNFKEAEMIVKKNGDASNTLVIPINTTRIEIDADGLADRL